MDLPKYPVYILSKGRYDNCLTANFMIEDNCPFYLVVEPQEYELYKNKYPEASILVLPSESAGRGAIPVRNYIWNHSIKNGFKRHWEFDDNIRGMYRLHKGKRIRCNSLIGINVLEEFTDRYTNIAISGFDYTMFTSDTTKAPYKLNCHVYSAMLIKNDIPYRWRLKFNADTDICLQVLHNKFCTVLFSIFNVQKIATMTAKGGNTERYKGNGRLKMARTLEEIWPQYVETKWRFNRPQHVIKQNWKMFTQPLIKRTDIDWDTLKQKTFNIPLKVVKEVKSESLKKFYHEYNEGSN